MLTEAEIIDRHRQSLLEAADHCKWLARQQDAGLAEPRGKRYMALRQNLNELEGSCQQAAHFRGDARWIKLGIVYAKAMRMAQIKYIGQNWKAFGQMVQIFEKGLRTMDELATRRTERRGVILPTQSTDWLILPDWNPFGRPGPASLH